MILKIIICFSVICVTLIGKTSVAAELEEHPLSKEFSNYFATGYASESLKNLIKELDVKSIIQGENKVPDSWPQPKISLFCTTCATVANQLLQSNSSEAVIDLCIRFCLDFGLGNEAVCEGIINADAPGIIYIVQNSPDLTGNDLCGVAFESSGCVSHNPDRIWNVTLPDVPKPPIDEPPYPDPSSVPTLKVLHLADTHFDPYYLPYSNAKCPEEYLCCRAESGPVQHPNDVAGFWGDYRNCDLPKWTLEALYENINKTSPDLDFILWTGDLVPHNVWNVSREGVLSIIHEMADLIKEYFPGIPVFPAVGNHDSNPVDQFSQPYVDDPEFNMSWLYDELVQIWGAWLPAEAALGISYAGFYSTQIRPGLRVLSLNTNFCYSSNWWLIYDSVDIADELKRLAEELQKSEDIGESVYIISHHAPSSCFYIWSHQYNLIIARYENTITGLFYSHSHSDQFRLFFDPEDSERVFEVGYIGQSQTPYSFLNPGYKIYTIEGDFPGSKYRVLDHDNWIIELDVANIRNYTEVVHLYSAREAYGLTDLSPQSLLNFIYQMNEPNNTMYMDFHRNKVKGATPSLSCDEGCKIGDLCSLLEGDSSVNYCYKLWNETATSFP